ncbi:hypothetical protein E8A73_021360 [Polyangium aurulentum]|nr:hypothetical protein E8A73_021360 [Polyangium aurulentum]
MGEQLARIVDLEALESSAGPRGRHAIEVPSGWEGSEIDVAVPTRVACARCDGGGCDACGRRGGHRIPGDITARTLRVRLPQTLGDGVVLRFVDPFHALADVGDGAPLAQLLLEMRRGSAASAGVTRVRVTIVPSTPMRLSVPPPMPTSKLGARIAAVATVAIALATLVALVAGR